MSAVGGRADVACQGLSGPFVAEAVEKVFRGVRGERLIRQQTEWRNNDSNIEPPSFDCCGNTSLELCHPTFSTGGHPASHVARWNGLHLVNRGGGGIEKTPPKSSARADTMSLSGRRCWRNRPSLCDASNEASAVSTLIRQRPPTPSCRGHSPHCGENSEPGRRIKGELDIQSPS